MPGFGRWLARRLPIVILPLEHESYPRRHQQLERVQLRWEVLFVTAAHTRLEPKPPLGAPPVRVLTDHTRLIFIAYPRPGAGH